MKDAEKNKKQMKKEQGEEQTVEGKGGEEEEKE